MLLRIFTSLSIFLMDNYVNFFKLKKIFFLEFFYNYNFTTFLSFISMDFFLYVSRQPFMFVYNTYAALYKYFFLSFKVDFRFLFKNIFEFSNIYNLHGLNYFNNFNVAKILSHIILIRDNIYSPDMKYKIRYNEVVKSTFSYITYTNKVIIICNRTNQNYFFTLTDLKGDVIYKISIGYLFSSYSNKLRLLLKKNKNIKRMTYETRKKFRSYRRKLTKVKSKYKRYPTFKHLRMLLNSFCDNITYIMATNPFYSKIVSFDLVFIQFESNLHQIIEHFVKRLGLKGKYTLLQVKRVRWSLRTKVKRSKIYLCFLLKEYKILLSLLYSYRKDKYILSQWFSIILNYYVFIRYYYWFVRKYKTINLVDRMYLLNLIKIKQKLIFY